MKIGMTGHQQRAGMDWPWIEATLTQFLTNIQPPLVGVSSLAIGADQLFAEVIFSLGGQLEVIIPYPEYDHSFDQTSLIGYKYFLSKSKSTQLERVGTDEDCYLAAGELIVKSSEILVTIWDGLPAHGRGGTSDVVQFALNNRVPVYHIDFKNYRSQYI